MSPRDRVRIACTDASGQTLNSYIATRRLDQPVPLVPWAVYLTDEVQCYRLICFDLDAKTPGLAGTAQLDAERVCEHLAAVGLDMVLCLSGPGGGRHVWTALTDSVEAATVATLARLMRTQCPTLDLAPLTNPVTGCVRPPGAPHRDGGASTIVTGCIETLTHPTGTASQVRALVERLAATIEAPAPAQGIDPAMPLPVDPDGHIYLPGQRRPLPASAATALEMNHTGLDASATTWKILIGAAAARWRHCDIAALVPHSTGLEHLRSRRIDGRRLPRTPGDTARTLARQWDKAVRHVAARQRQIGEDPTFDTRADQLASHIRELQDRADSSPGRWASRGGPADRRVLDALSLLALQAISCTIEADTRRLALLTGIGRETARTALKRLADDGWITLRTPAHGPHGSRWTLPQKVIHTQINPARSQAIPRPAGAGTAERSTLINLLSQRLAASAHDLFAPSPGLGLAAGNLYARLSPEPQTLLELSRATGLSNQATLAMLSDLHAAGVAHNNPRGWQCAAEDHRDDAALARGVQGRLETRAARYRTERVLWAWWQAEYTWMTTPGRNHRRRRPTIQQQALALGRPWDVYPVYPRHHQKANHLAARTAFEHGALDYLTKGTRTT